MNLSCSKRPLPDSLWDEEEWDGPGRPAAADRRESKRWRQERAQPVWAQGWGRCSAGFDDASLIEEGEELEGTGKGSVRKRRGRMKTSLRAIALEKEQESSLDIDWSSSSDSLSDVELLPQEMARPTDRGQAQRKPVGRTPKPRRDRGGRVLGVRGRMPRPVAEADELQIAEEEGEGAEEGGERDPPLSRTESSPLPPQQGKKSTQIDISDYDSPSEEQLTATSSPQQESGSLHISDQSPTPQSTPADAEGPAAEESPRTGTELLKKLRLPPQTPETETEGGGGDSAKKKRRFVRGGLAESLQRVLNREKSAVSFWAHRSSETPTESQALLLDLRVLSAEDARGLLVTRCQTRPLTPQASPEVFVLFTRADWRHLNLGVGSRVRVHPPWQKMTLPSHKEPVILCTYFCHALTDTEDEMPADLANQSSLPAAAERSLSESPHTLKPTQLFGPSTGPLPAEPVGSTLQSVQPHPTEAPRAHVSDSFLDSIAHSGAYSAAGMCVRAVVSRVYFRGHRTNTPPARKRPGAGKGLEGETSHRSLEGETSQWTLLLQDRQGVFCELQATLDGGGQREREWRRILSQSEGKTRVFAGLRVLRRVNRTRLPALFSLIDSRWLPGDATASQSDAESQDSRSQGLLSPQNFCYILGVQTAGDAIREDVPDGVRIPHRDSVRHTLRDVQRMPEAISQRLSLCAKVVHSHPETQHAPRQPAGEGDAPVWHLFLTDDSLGAEGGGEVSGPQTVAGGEGRRAAGSTSGRRSAARMVHVCVRPSCRLSGSLQGSLARPGCLLLLQDLCLDQGHLYADMYTSLHRLKGTDCSNLPDEAFVTSDPENDDIIGTLSRTPVPQISDISAGAGENSLVSVSGSVVDIDLTSAYSWPACDSCGNERLEADPASAGQLHCGECQRSVTSPLTLMHLEVFLRCPSMEEVESDVKVQLLQSHIERILPPVSTPEAGYELQCILGANIGPMVCFLRAVTQEAGRSLTFELEEIALGESQAVPPDQLQLI